MTFNAKQYLIALLVVPLMAGCSAQRAQAGDPCFHKGTMFSDGGASCQSGLQYKCHDGEWLALRLPCADGAVAMSRVCQFGGISFSTGSASCQAGTQYRCEDGVWRSLAMPCTVGDSPIRVIPEGRTCMFGGATVSSNSTICQAGITYFCNDGQWVNLGTLCR